MSVILPNIEDSPSFDAMAVRDSVDFFAATSDAQQTGVLTGMTVTQDTGSDMKIAVAAGTYEVAGVSLSYAGGSGIVIQAASSTDRRDTIVATSSGVTVIMGNPAPAGSANWTRTASSLPPVKTMAGSAGGPSTPGAIPASCVVLGEVYVAAATTVITTATNVVDKTNVIVPPIVNSTTALSLALTETVNYPPTSPLKGNTALWIQQNETFSALPPVSAISGSGSLWTITFASSILGTLGQVGDTFPCWTVDFLPSGWNVGNQFSTVTATITDSTHVTIPQSFSTTATQLGTVQPLPVQSSAGFFGDRGIVQLEGTNSFVRPPNVTDGIGPAFQSNMVFKPATAITATLLLTSGSNLATISGLPPAGIFVGMNVVDTTNPTYLPAGTVVGNVYYTISGTTTTITLVNKYSLAAQNPIGLGGTSSDSLSFCNDILTAEQFVTGVYGLSHGQDTQMVPNVSYPTADVPGLAQGWGQGYWVGSAWEGEASHTLTGVKQADFMSALFLGQNANVAEWVGFVHFDVSKPTGITSGSLGTQIAMATGLWTGIAPTVGVAHADAGSALSALSTLTLAGGSGIGVANILALLPAVGSGVIFASDGMHAFNWTGISSATLTGCTYSGNQAATVAEGNLVQFNPQFLNNIFGATNIGVLNASTTAFPSQAPTAHLTSAMNGLSTGSIPLQSTTVAAGSNGTALSALTSLVLASTASFGATGVGTLTHSGIKYIFTWTGNNTGTNTLSGCLFTGLQTITVSTGDAVAAGNVVAVDSVQWFPDLGGSLYVSNGSGAVGQMTYGGTTATFITGTGTATALSALSTLTVHSTAQFPTAGTATIMTNNGPHTVTWTAVGSATTLTGCTYSGSTADTTINGAQIFLATTTTGPTGLGPAFWNCANTLFSSTITMTTGMTVISAPGGGNFQAQALLGNGTPICVGPGFQLPPPNATKMSLFTQAASSAALTVPLFTGLTPAYDGMEVRLVNSALAAGSTITFTSNGTSHGTALSLGAGTRVVTNGGCLVLGWDANSNGSSATTGEWVEYSASNLGGHGS